MHVSAPMAFAFTVEYWLFFVLKAVAVGVEAWALADVLRRSPQAFQRAGQRTKGFWTVLTAVALAIGTLSLLAGQAGIGLFALAAVTVAAVYLAGPRSEAAFYGR